ncbi:hypothetical protein ACJX0J_008303 [Zea mays]
MGQQDPAASNLVQVLLQLKNLEVFGLPCSATCQYYTDHFYFSIFERMFFETSNRILFVWLNIYLNLSEEIHKTHISGNFLFSSRGIHIQFIRKLDVSRRFIERNTWDLSNQFTKIRMFMILISLWQNGIDAT